MQDLTEETPRPKPKNLSLLNKKALIPVPSLSRARIARIHWSRETRDWEQLGGFNASGLGFWSFRKLGVPYLGVLLIRILLFRVLY